eukprot:CAMPEP_0172376768 /NCGR_PEP_ID=MMETSP1060-20121228/68556_1 /TAXON_ID=37318 /ORGANISM="Pseudo-nitzschia pungens, Strain cf. cingulata" /LENGTH=721 /DNA_ID=CAMNT_0013104427 /DNA_START=194 /DNA_END=2359 /DNA_ORIENTATION=-
MGLTLLLLRTLMAFVRLNLDLNRTQHLEFNDPSWFSSPTDVNRDSLFSSGGDDTTDDPDDDFPEFRDKGHVRNDFAPPFIHREEATDKTEDQTTLFRYNNGGENLFLSVRKSTKTPKKGGNGEAVVDDRGHKTPNDEAIQSTSKKQTRVTGGDLTSQSSREKKDVKKTTKTNKKEKKKSERDDGAGEGLAENPQEDHALRRPLNVVVFFPDDLNHKSIQDVSGSDYVKTPFLTTLAKDGIRFARNAVTTSICWMSRATLFTGQFTSSHGSILLNCPRFTLPQYWKESWVALLQRFGGYYVGHVGKWQYKYNDGLKNMFNYSKFFEGKHWYQQFKAEDISASDLSVKHAVEFLQSRPKDRHFALTVAFYPPKAVGSSSEPGAQWSPKQSSAQLYADKVYERPYDIDAAHANLPPFLQEAITRNRYLERWNTEDQYTAGMRNYHALVTEVDTACSQIVDELKRQGLYENTMIIFTSDNGLMMGAHGIGGKWVAYEESIHVPLIIHDPRIPSDKRGSVSDAMTLNIDLASTILGAANITPPEGMQGRDIADLYLQPDEATTKLEEKPWRTEYLYEFPIWRVSSNALIGERYKYIEWPGEEYEQLFDLQKDPFELNDLLRKLEEADSEDDSENNTFFEELAVGLLETLHGVKASPSELEEMVSGKGGFVSLLDDRTNDSEGAKTSLRDLVQGLLFQLKKRYENVLAEVQGPGGKPDWCNASLPYP